MRNEFMKFENGYGDVFFNNKLRKSHEIRFEGDGMVCNEIQY